MKADVDGDAQRRRSLKPKYINGIQPAVMSVITPVLFLLWAIIAFLSDVSAFNTQAGCAQTAVIECDSADCEYKKKEV